uniref:Uncharacterized protein n=1 Tax=Acrobeloides nanus TaxID=290746 RepID=A0A914D6I2_9BILA
MDCLNNPEKFNVKRFNFTQPLDHFNSSETRKWSQQTQWRNDTFKPKSDGDIIFLLIGEKWLHMKTPSVHNFYSKNIQSGKLYTVRHFMAEGVPKTTLYDILRRYDNNLPATRQPGSGGSNAKLIPRNLVTLKRQFDNKDGIGLLPFISIWNAFLLAGFDV